MKVYLYWFALFFFKHLTYDICQCEEYCCSVYELLRWIRRYARVCSSYECFILRAMRLSNKLLGQGYVKERLKSSLRKFYGRYRDLTKQYEVPVSRMLHDILENDHIQWHPPLIGPREGPGVKSRMCTSVSPAWS